MSEPFAAFDAGGLPGGLAARFRRLEALEEAAGRREQAQRAARAEERHEQLLARRMQEAWARGEPLDPMNPTSLGHSHEQITQEVMAEMDREDAAAALAELIGGGRGGWIHPNGSPLPRPDPDPSDAPPKVLTAAEQVAARAETDAADARARREAVRSAASKVYRRINQEQDQARQRARQRREAELAAELDDLVAGPHDAFQRAEARSR